MFDLIRELCALDGVSGWEDEVRAAIRSRAVPYAQQLYEDSMGNLFVLRRGKARRSAPLLVCAHMDEVGLIIREVTDEGYLKFACVGGVDRRVLIGKRVRVGPKKLPGVIGVKAVHLTTKEERKSVPKTDELYIDIGAETRAQAEKLVALGDVAAFESAYGELGRNIKAKALDDRVGCAVMLTLLSETLRYDTWFVFTVQEEVGCRGAAIAAYSLAPAGAVVLEGTTAADLPGMDGARAVCRLDQGAVIGCMDRSTIYDRALFDALVALARDAGVPWQVKQLIAGGTDAGVIHRTRAGIPTASISAPVRYIHSPSCVTSRASVEAVAALAREFVNSDAVNQILVERSGLDA